MLFSEPKIPQFNRELTPETIARVSVLFSEPKIPQSCWSASPRMSAACFSALQRAENSSMIPARRPSRRTRTFQCSSASRKFLNLQTAQPGRHREMSFSALQRAENSSIVPERSAGRATTRFSALQRAENSSMRCSCSRWYSCHFCFSALQRAENSSMYT